MITIFTSDSSCICQYSLLNSSLFNHFIVLETLQAKGIVVFFVVVEYFEAVMEIFKRFGWTGQRGRTRRTWTTCLNAGLHWFISSNLMLWFSPMPDQTADGLEMRMESPILLAGLFSIEVLLQSVTLMISENFLLYSLAHCLLSIQFLKVSLHL